MSVKVYSMPHCPQCVATYRALDKAGINYETINLTENPEAFDFVKTLGYAQAPVVVTDDSHWAGFRPDKIKALSNTLIPA